MQVASPRSGRGPSGRAFWPSTAQLAVKGLLHGTGAPAWGHDLAQLVSQVSASLGMAWPTDIDDASARLGRHYIPTRCPDAHPSGPPGAHYRASDATQALADAQSLVAAVDDSWRRLSEQ